MNDIIKTALSLTIMIVVVACATRDRWMSFTLVKYVVTTLSVVIVKRVVKSIVTILSVAIVKREVKYVATTLSLVFILSCVVWGFGYWKSLEVKPVEQDTSNYSSSDISVTPEPSTVIALVTGLGSLWIFRRKK